MPSTVVRWRTPLGPKKRKYQLSILSIHGIIARLYEGVADMHGRNIDLF
jgi:hypothetical protein